MFTIEKSAGKYTLLIQLKTKGYSEGSIPPFRTMLRTKKNEVLGLRKKKKKKFKNL